MKQYFLLLLLVQAVFVNAQNVGIGTTTPSRAKLEVHGVAPNSNTSAVFGSDGKGVSFQRDWPTIGFNQYRKTTTGYGSYINNGFGGIQYLDPGSGNWYIDMVPFGSYNNEIATVRRVLRMTPAATVHIGNSAHNSTLSVSRGSALSTAYFGGTNYHSLFNSGSAENTYIRAGKDGGTVFINDIPGSKVSLTGLVGINTGTPTYPLEYRQPVNGRGIILVEENTFANWEWLVTTEGDLHLNNAGGIGKGYFKKSDGTYHTYSDRRLKTAIEDLPSLLNKYMQLQPVSYQMIYNNPDKKTSIGFIAQDVKVLFPELVSIATDATNGYNDIPDVHTLNYEGITVLTIKAMQEQEEFIKAQRQRINKLKAKLEFIKTQLALVK